MLLSMRVKNLALVDDININFHKGLNILTGETGAGKSVLMNSIHLCLGGKADKSLISYGKDYALVEVSFSIDDNMDIYDTLNELGISIDDDFDNIVTISRKIGDKSVCRINGETVNTKSLQLIGKLLLDSHSQHETSKLLDTNKHIDILDKSCSLTNESELKVKSNILYKEWKEKCDELEKARNEKRASNREISLAQYEIEEIENANLTLEEDKILEEKYKLMQNSKNIYSCVYNSLQLLTNSENGECVDSILWQINKQFAHISNINMQTENLYSKILDIQEYIKDLSYSLNDFLNDCQFSDEEFYEIENRLDLINSFKNKYGNTIEEILNFCEERKEYISKMENYEEYLSNLEKEEKELKSQLDEIHSQITKQRTNAAIMLSKEMEDAMHGLNFNEAKFRVDIKESNITPNGRDKVEFMTILNKGMQEQPLANVASGGELSRVMLALKSVIAQKDNIETLVFDEIDSGISGNTAWLVGERLYSTAIGRQILCITHLPQIASFANYHYMIEKKDDENKAYTNIFELDENGIDLELKRLSGVENEDGIKDLRNKATSIRSKYQ